MKFIEINKGLCINASTIRSIESKDDNLSCVVKTESTTYTANVPYEILIRMLSEDSKKLEKIYRIMQTQGNFAG